MNHANAIAVVRGFQAGVFCAVVGAMLGCASANPESGSNKQELVDCLLPGQIRQLDETVTYLTERRLVRTTKTDCTGRGGEIQPSGGPTEEPSR